MSTKIEWADETWSPITGCTKISEGCKHCYAERMARRLAGRFGYPEAPDHFQVTVHEDKMDQPLRWKKPRRIFVVSMGDLFHPGVPFEVQLDLLVTMTKTPQHRYLVLTKRPEEMARAMRDFYLFHHEHHPWPNVWLGVTAENQKRADERIPTLLSIPAAGHFVSLEPMLSSIDLTGKPPLGWGAYGAYHEERLWPNALTGVTFTNDGSVFSRDNPKIDHVIAGGESGPGARPMHPDWARSVRDQCQASGTPFLFKQHGAWLHRSQLHQDTEDGCLPRAIDMYPWQSPQGQLDISYRVGKRAAGRLLDGELWDEYPKAGDVDIDE